MIEKAKAVYKIWEHWCPCGAGRCEPSDCPGPPSKQDQQYVLAWIEAHMEGVCPVSTFPEPELWPWNLASGEIF